MTKFQAEKDSIAFLGLMSIANAKFDNQFKHQDCELTHSVGLNIFATIIDNVDGEIIGQQRNTIHSFNNPMFHAEQGTLKEAIDRLKIKRPRNAEATSVENYYRNFLFNQPNSTGNFDIGGTIYTTLEPCPFCTSALLVNRMKRIIYILPDSKFGNSFKSLKHQYYNSYDMTYEQISIQDSQESDLISFASIQLSKLLKYVTENPELNGTLILDDLKDFLEECSQKFLNFNEDNLITTGNDRQRNIITLKGLQIKTQK